MINLNQYQILMDNRASLKGTSKDASTPGHIEYMSPSDTEVVNFDLVKRSYANQHYHTEEHAASVDAIFQHREGILFIEFKNGIVKSSVIKNKIRDSLLIFLDIIGETLTFSRSYIDFVLVYNLEKNSRSESHEKGKLQNTPSGIKIAEHIAKKAGEKYIRFDLERYKGLFFRAVYTLTKEEFNEYLKKLDIR